MFAAEFDDPIVLWSTRNERGEKAVLGFLRRVDRCVINREVKKEAEIAAERIFLSDHKLYNRATSPFE